MSTTLAYKWSLAIPIILPMLLFPVMYSGANLPEWLETVVAVIVWSGLLGGIPYAIVAVLLLLWARSRGEAQIRRGLLLSPLIMLLVFGAFLGIVRLLQNLKGLEGLHYREVMAFSIPCILILGYVYVGIVFGVVWLLRRKGVLISAHAI